jgi:hypothetical protein
MRKSIEATNRACDAVVDMVDEGSLYSVGRLIIYRQDSSVMSRHDLSNPAFLDSTDGTAVANTIYDATAMIDGTATTFDIVNRDASNVWDGSVSLINGSGDLQLPSVVIYSDSTINISSAFYAVPR